MISWSPRGKRRLLDCARFIAERCRDRQTVQGWIAQIYRAIERLEDFPRSGAVVREIGREEIREVTCGDYRIIYRLCDGKPEIVSIRHSRFLIRSLRSL